MAGWLVASRPVVRRVVTGLLVARRLVGRRLIAQRPMAGPAATRRSVVPWLVVGQAVTQRSGTPWLVARQAVTQPTDMPWLVAGQRLGGSLARGWEDGPGSAFGSSAIAGASAGPARCGARARGVAGVPQGKDESAGAHQEGR
ncbi:hypothetical protein ACFV4N_12165 [Actinosynnema sp. NPDC059797]